MFSANVQGYPATVRLSSVKCNTSSKLCKILFHSFGIRSECKLKDLCPYNKIPTYDKSKLRILNHKHCVKALSHIQVDNEDLYVPEDGTQINNVGNIKSEAPMNRTKMVNVIKTKNEYKSNSKTNSKLSKVKKVKKMVVPKKSKKDISISKGKNIVTKPEVSFKKSNQTKKINLIEKKCIHKLKNEGNSKLSKVKKISVPKISRKGIYISKRKIINTKLKAPFKNSNKLNIAEYLKIIENQPVVLLERYSEIKSAIPNKEKNTKNTNQNIFENKQGSKTTFKHSKVESVLKVSNVSMDNNKTAKTVQKVKDTLNSELSSSNSSNICQVSKYGRKIKPKKYFDCENFTEVQIYLRLNQENFKALENQNFKTKDKSLNLKFKSSLNSHRSASVPYINKSRAKKRLNLINENHKSQVLLNSNNVDYMANECGMKIQIPIQVNATVESLMSQGNNVDDIANECGTKVQIPIQVNATVESLMSQGNNVDDMANECGMNVQIPNQVNATIESLMSQGNNVDDMANDCGMKVQIPNQVNATVESLMLQGNNVGDMANECGMKVQIPIQVNATVESPMLQGNNVDDMANECGMKFQIPSQVNATVKSLKCTEFKLLDYIYKLRLSLQTDCFCYEAALESLDHISNLQITTDMLMKNKVVIDTITKVSKYSGNTIELGISEDDLNVYFKKSFIIRRKAEMILNKCVSLFTIPNGHLL